MFTQLSPETNVKLAHHAIENTAIFDGNHKLSQPLNLFANADTALFAQLPPEIRAKLLQFLMGDNFPAAKRLYDAWVRERVEEIA